MSTLAELSAAAHRGTPGAQAPATGRDRGRPMHLASGAGSLPVVDTLAGLGMLAAVVLTPDSIPDGVEAALGVRITVRNLLIVVALAIAWPSVFRAWGLYDARGARRKDEWRAIFGACTAGALVVAALCSLSLSGGLEAAQILQFWVGSTVTVVGARAARRVLVARSARNRPRRVLILGSGPRAVRAWHALSHDPHTSYTLAGFVDAPRAQSASDLVAQRLLCSVEDLEATLLREAIDEVYIALPVKSQYAAIQHAVSVCERAGVRARYDIDVFQHEVAWPRYDEAGGPGVTLLVAADDQRLTVKRILDVVAAAAALAFLLPVFAIIAAAVKLDSPGPVIFAQERYGLNRRRFKMLKFRTMSRDAEELQAALEHANEATGPVFKIGDDPRVTPVGRFLRRTSLDELPQFYNVLRGEMSLVGPRPLPLRDVGRFTRAGDMRRFSVRPGLTCLWQVSGRSSLPFEEWVRLDLQYIDEWSLALDAAILARTIPAVWRGTGAS